MSRKKTSSGPPRSPSRRPSARRPASASAGDRRPAHGRAARAGYAGIAPFAWLAGPGRRRRGGAGDRRALVMIRDIPNRRVARAGPAPPAVDGFRPAAPAWPRSGAQTSPEQIVVGQTGDRQAPWRRWRRRRNHVRGHHRRGHDRTFVGGHRARHPRCGKARRGSPRAWYLLRIDPGSAKPDALTPLPIPGDRRGAPMWRRSRYRRMAPSSQVALQPDGLNDPSAVTYLRVYSVATGAAAAFVVRDRRGRPLPDSRNSWPGPFAGRTAISRSPGWVSAGWRSGTAGSYPPRRGRVRRLGAEGDPRPDPVYLPAAEKRR